MARLVYTWFYTSVYTSVYSILLPFIVLRLYWRAIKAPAYAQRITERFGCFAAPDFDVSPIWIHSVSVGETLAAAPMIRRLLDETVAPLVITTTTPTGSARVQEMWRAELQGGRIFHVYAPYDLPLCVGGFLRRTHPSLLVVMETELWPNLIHQCHRQKILIVIANARLSEKSARGYRRIAPLTRVMLQEIDCIAAQSSADAQRFFALGLPQQQCKITGSIKFDVNLESSLQEAVADLYRQWHEGHRLVWIAASTHEGEDELILAVFLKLRKQFRDLRLVLVPRHPERFTKVYQLCVDVGFKTQRRSVATAIDNDTAVIVGDTMGEMLLMFGASDMAFIGGSLIRHGGHNMLEACAWSLPVASGPSLYNFTEASRLLLEAGGMRIVNDTDELGETIKRWCEDERIRHQVGLAGYQVVEGNRGALDRLLGLIRQHLPDQPL